jgi:hypothetical protein
VTAVRDGRVKNIATCRYDLFTVDRTVEPDRVIPSILCRTTSVKDDEQIGVTHITYRCTKDAENEGRKMKSVMATSNCSPWTSLMLCKN